MIIILHSPDIEQTKGFYTILGLDFVPEKHGQGSDHFAIRLPETSLEIYPARTDEIAETILGFYVTERAVIVPKLLAAGGEMVTSLPEPDAPNRSLLMKDPDGRLLRLFNAS